MADHGHLTRPLLSVAALVLDDHVAGISIYAACNFERVLMHEPDSQNNKNNQSMADYHSCKLSSASGSSLNSHASRPPRYQ